MKKLLTIAFLLCSIMQALADTWTDSNGIVWNYSVENGNAVQVKPNDKSSITGDLVIPDYMNSYPVISIANAAFQYCSDLTSITIPNSVTSISNAAFMYCSGLISITIPNSVTSIGIHAFDGCSGLTSITIPNSVTSIGSSVFRGCSGLTSIAIPNSVTTIGQNAFNGCSGLTSITIPNSVTIIDSYAFDGCSGLTSITIPNSVMGIANGAFYNCSGLTSIMIPNSVTIIGSGAFEDCSSLTSVIVDNTSPISITEDVFTNRANATLYVPAGNKAAYEAADYWKEFNNIIETFTANTVEGVAMTFMITSEANKQCQVFGSSSFPAINSSTTGALTIPSAVNDYSVTGIKNAAFWGCSGLTSITIPNSVTGIGSAAFMNCSGLTSITIPNSVTGIGNVAFMNCSGLTSITIPNSVTSIGISAFNGCSDLTSITIPNSVTGIGNAAFSGCSGLTSIMIPNSVTVIGYGTFKDCSSLTTVIVENTSPISITEDVFTNRANATLYVPAGSKATYEAADYWKEFKTIVENISFADANVKAICVANWDANRDGELSVAEAAAVTSLGEVFKENKQITSFNELQFFTGLTSIGDYAFQRCEALKTIIIPEGVTTIGLNAFSGCYHLWSVKIPNSVTTIKGAAFLACNNLTTIILPKGLTSIGSSVFYGCAKLESINLLETKITSISDYLFWACDALASISIPAGVTTIGKSAFEDCDVLSNVNMPNSLKIISEGAFYACDALASIDIPHSVTSIGETVFGGCDNLTEVYVNWETPVAITENVFSNRTNAILYVPAGSKAAYQTADYWKDFKEVVEMSAPAGTEANPFTCADANAFAAGLTADTPTGTEYYVKGKVCSIEENFNFKNGMATFWISDDGTQNGKFYIYRTNYYRGAHGGRIPNLGDEVILYGKLVNYQGITPETASGESRLVSINDKTTNRPIEKDDLFAALTDGDVGMYFVAGCPARPGSSTGSTNIGCSVGYAVNGMQTGLPAAIDADYNGNVTIPETVEGLEVRTIAPYAFANTKLKGVIIPSNVWDIEVYAFSGCTELAAVSLPENIILNRGTFKDCTSLTDIKLPKGVILYGGSNDDPIFSGCTSLTAIRVFDETPYALENKLVDDPSKVTLYVPAGSKAAYETADYWKDFGEIYEIFSAPIQLNDGTVDAQFRIIDENAKTVETFGTFRLGPAIEKATEGSITIPAEVNGYQVVGIGSWSFRDCENITHVSLPATITTIGASAFRTCYQLQEVNIPEGVTSIGLYAFKSCIFSSLTLPSSLQTIEEVAFEGCNELTSVTMSGSTPPTIGEYTFNINNPSNVTIYVPLGSLVAYQTADYWKDFKEIVEMGTEANPFTCAEANAFVAGLPADQTTAETYYIKGKVSTIANNFGYKYGYATFKISDDGNKDGEFNVFHTLYFDKQKYDGGRIPNLGDEVVLCGKLINHEGTSYETAEEDCKLVSINNNTTGSPIVGNDLFSSMTADYGNDLFFVAGCITDPTKPNSNADNIGCSVGYAVSGNPATYSGPPTAIDANYEGTVLLPGVADGFELRTIAPSAFAGAKLSAVVVPPTVWDIETDAFKDCQNLASVTLPEGVILNAGTFQNCTALTSIALPKGVRLYGMESDHKTFGGCTNLTSIMVNDETPYNLQGSYLVDDPSNVTLCVPVGSKAAYEAADYWKEFKTIVEGISFADANVKAICVANWDTNGDGELSVAEAAAVTDLGEVFTENRDITSFDELRFFTGLTSIGNHAFRRCEALTSIIIPGNVTDIKAAFLACTSLKSVTIPASVTGIHAQAFSWCTNLEAIHVEEGNSTYDSRENCNAIITTALNRMEKGCRNTVFPNSVTIIGSSCFEGSDITTIDIPSTITVIRRQSFRDCYGLTSIVIPNSVTSIEYGAFNRCDNLNEVYVNWETPVAITEDVFSNRTNATLYVPAGSKAAYEAADYWKEFKTIVENISFADANVKAICVANWDTNGDGELSVAEAAAVESLGEVFKDNGEITSFDELRFFTGLKEMPEWVTFGNCTELKAITIPANVISLGGATFANCTSLEQISVDPGNTKYDSHNGCNGVIETDANKLVVGCWTTDIPATVTTIGSAAFWGRWGMSLMILPESVKVIENSAFAFCISLEDISLPTSLETIESCGFQYSGLKSISLPASLTTLGESAFEGCEELTEVTVLTPEPLMLEEGKTFTNRTNATLRVPKGSKAAYRSVNVWKEFKKIVEIGDEETEEMANIDLTDVSQMDDAIYFNQVMTKAGSDIVVPIMLKNIKYASGYQFELVLPDGVTVTHVEMTDRNPGNFQLSRTVISDNITRFLAYSFSTKSIAAGDDAILNVTLHIADDMKNGKYGVLLQKQMYSTSGGQAVRPNNVTTALTIGEVNYTIGDVNSDGYVDVADIVSVVNYILGKPSDDFVIEAADANNDGFIDVADVVSIVNIILGKNPARMRAPEVASTDNDRLMLTRHEDDSFTLDLDNEGCYVAAQFDIRLSEGQQLEGIQLNGKRFSGHSLSYTEVAENTYRVLVYSMGNGVIRGNNGELLTIHVSGAAGGVAVENIMFITSAKEKIEFAPLFSQTTGIAGINTFMEPADVYSLDGYLVRKSATSLNDLPKGVYIVNGRKVVK